MRRKNEKNTTSQIHNGKTGIKNINKNCIKGGREIPSQDKSHQQQGQEDIKYINHQYLSIYYFYNSTISHNQYDASPRQIISQKIIQYKCN